MRKLYADVPQELVDVMNQINFPVIPDSEQTKLMEQLRAWVMSDLVKKGHVKLRKTHGEFGRYMTRQSVPDAAFDLLNSFDYGKPAKVIRIQLRNKAVEYLRSINIPLYPTAMAKPATA